MPSPEPDGLPHTDDVVPGTRAQQLSSDLSDTLRSAPDLAVAPSLALSVAKYGGPVTENAQAVSAVAKSRATDIATSHLQNSVGPERDVLAGPDIKSQVPAGFIPGGVIGGGVVADVEKVLSTASKVADVLEAASPMPSPHSFMENPVGMISDLVHSSGSPSGLSQFLKGQEATAMSAPGPQELKTLNSVFTMPSHTFRYLYDIRARHGNAAMLKAALPMFAGGAAAALLTRSPEEVEETEAAIEQEMDEEGATSESEQPSQTKAQGRGQAARTAARKATETVLKPAKVATHAIEQVTTSPIALGAELGGYAGGMVPKNPITYPDSWTRTANATTWTLPDGKVGPTFGRMVAGDLGLHPGAASYNAISGTLDAFMQIGAPDPLGAAGRVIGKANSAEGFADSYLGRRFAGGTAPRTPDEVEAAVTQYPQIKAAMKDITGMKTAGEVISAYPQLAAVANKLAKTTTVDETVDVFKDLARTEELSTTSKLPTYTPYGATKRALAESGAPGTRIFAPTPIVFAKGMRRFSGETFPIGAPESIPAIGQLLHAAGENDDVVKEVMTDLAGNADPRYRITIVKNATKAYFTRAILSSFSRDASDELKSVTLSSMNDAVDRLYGGEAAGHVGQFGRDKEGSDLSLVSTDSGDPESKTFAAALWFNQADHFRIPSVREMNVELRALEQSEKWTAANAVLTRGSTFTRLIDQIVNEKIFQPLALATAGWASRVSLSEDTLNILRHGPLNFTAAKIASSAEKQGFKLNNDEISSFMAVVHGVLAGIPEGVVKTLGRDRILDGATALIKLHDGHIVHPALDGTHGTFVSNTDIPDVASQDIRAHLRREGILPGKATKNVSLSDQYTVLAPASTGFYRSWSEYAGRIAHDKLGSKMAEWYKAALDANHTHDQAAAFTIDQAERFLNSQDVNDLSVMTRHYARTPGSNLSPHRDWAQQATKAMQGALFGQDGTFHANLLKQMVDKQVPSTEGMLKTYAHMDVSKLPQAMPGREVAPFSGWDILQRASNKLHANFLGPIVNALSREPTYVLDFVAERKLLETKVRLGQMTQDQADVVSEIRAINKSIRFVHNPIDRLNLENTLHVVAPFYFAQNQALRRVGRLLAENPGAFEQYVKLMMGANKMVGKLTASNGEPVFIVPGTTIAGEGITGALGALQMPAIGSIPIGLTGSADVSTTINPISAGEDENGAESPLESAFQPSFGPSAAIPLKAIQGWAADRAPKVAQAAATAEGPVASDEQFWLQLLPNSLLQHMVQTGVGALTEGNQDAGSDYTTSMLSVMAAMAENGDLPSGSQLIGNDPIAREKFIRQASNLTTVAFIARTAADFLSPIALSLGQANLQFSTMAQDYINKAGGNVSKGLDDMTRAHPNLVPSEVFKSQSSNGYSFPEVEKTGEWIDANRSLVTKYPSASVFLVPNTDTEGQFSESALNLERAMGLRRTLTPTEFFNQIYVTAGDSYYYDTVYPAIQKALKGEPDELANIVGPTLTSSLRDDTTSYNVWSVADQALKNYGTSVNPIWYSSWQSNQSLTNRIATIGQMRTMLDDPSTPKSEQATHLGYLVNAYYRFQGTITNESLTSAEAKATWNALMDQAVKAYPDTKTAVQSVFRGAY